ncbi:MAG: hypothetical protein IPL58_16250 [Betaproteobacteria bacterium]|uniref:Uncharacterized protein n=1 Tax=Candidatus Proximibacter danicus TaxID=2954365 RepID=A0A9D7K6F8_9PROT|nr:hypothetical protein [Candidatus Proximibacter danicus]
MSNRIDADTNLPIAEGFLEPKTQSPDSLRRSGLWHLLLPWGDGLRHVLPQPESLCARIPRVAMMWIAIAGGHAGKSLSIPHGSIKSRAGLALGHGGTGALAGRGRTPICRD